MFRLLVIGKTDAISKEAASWVVSGENVGNKYGKRYEVSSRSAFIRAFPISVGQKGAPAIGDALLLVAKTPDDFTAMEPFIESYKRIPIKFVLYDGAPEQKDFEARLSAKPLKKGTPIEFVEKLIEANNDLIKLIATVFKKFDKDGNGTIELSELKMMSEELGSGLSDKEATEMIKIMDTNKDGKISLEEFIAWWKTGCQGSSQRILSLIKEISQKNPLINKIIEFIKMLKPPPQTDKVIEANFGFYLNRFKLPGASFELTAMSIGKELDEELKVFSDAVEMTKGDTFVGLAFGVKQPKVAVVTLEDIIGASVMMGTSLSKKAAEVLSNIDFKYGVAANKAIACAIPSMKGSTNLAPLIPLIEQLSRVILPNEAFTFKLLTATDYEKLTNDERPIIDLIFDGISVELKGKINPYIKERVYEIIMLIRSMHLPPGAAQPALSPAIAPMLSSLKGEIELDPTQALKDSFKESMPEELFIAPTKSLREAVIPILKDTIASIPVLEMTHEFLKNEVSNITILSYVSGVGAMKIVVDFPGLPLFLAF